MVQVYTNCGFSPRMPILSLLLGFVAVNIQLLPLIQSSFYYQNISHLLQVILITGNIAWYFYFFPGKMELGSPSAHSATVILANASPMSPPTGFRANTK